MKKSPSHLKKKDESGNWVTRALKIFIKLCSTKTIFLPYLESSMLKMPVKIPVHKESFRIFHLSSFETACPKNRWTGLGLRPWGGGKHKYWQFDMISGLILMIEYQFFNEISFVKVEWNQVICILLFLQVAELREELTSRGLNTKGNKQELVDRLTEHIQQGGKEGGSLLFLF